MTWISLVDLFRAKVILVWARLPAYSVLASVASVSVGFYRTLEAFSTFWPHENWGEDKKCEVGERRRGAIMSQAKKVALHC